MPGMHDKCSLMTGMGVIRRINCIAGKQDLNAPCKMSNVASNDSCAKKKGCQTAKRLQEHLKS